jgi:hypothetical protein
VAAEAGVVHFETNPQDAVDHIGKMATALDHPLVNGDFRRTISAYLALEMAKAEHNEGRYMRMAMHLLHSLVLKPRMQLALKRWWPVRRRLSDAET